MRHKIRILLVVSLIAVLLLSGCNLLNKNVQTVVSLTKSALANVGKAESAEIKMKSSGDITATYEVLNIGINLSMDSDIDMEMTRDPERSKGTVDLTLGAVGQEETVSGVFYADTAESGEKTTFIRWNDGSWMKRTTAAPTPEETIEKEFGDHSFTLPDSITHVVGILKAMSDGTLTAELKEETVMVNEKEAYQISCVMSGEFLKQILDTGEISLGGLTSSTENIIWEDVSVPAEIYIYKETELPARITMDCTTIASQVVDDLFEGYMEQLPVDGIRLDVNSYKLDIMIDRYDEIDPIEIPEEVSDATESETLMPSLTDAIKFW